VTGAVQIVDVGDAWLSSPQTAYVLRRVEEEIAKLRSDLPDT
jgi:hypothetical protein